MAPPRELVKAARLLHEVLRIARRKRVDFVAGGITYYEFFSLVPLLILSFLVLSLFGGEEIAAAIILGAGRILPSAGQDLVYQVLSQDVSRTSLIGLLILGWASIQLFRSFDIAFEQIYDMKHAETLMEEVEDALVALITLGIAVTITVAAGVAVTVVPGIQLVGVIWTITQFIGLTVIFIPLYHVFTEQRYTIRQLLPGALVAAAGWTLLQTLFGVYTGLVGGSLYEAFGGVLLLIIWMYLGNTLILLGAVVNLVYNRKTVEQALANE